MKKNWESHVDHSFPKTHLHPQLIDDMTQSVCRTRAGTIYNNN